jgi:hypothetical protein
MATLTEIRAQHPEYGDLSDQQLADGLYKKFYADMPRDQFDAKIGLVSAGKGDRLPFAPGVTPHAMPVDTVQQGPTPEPPSVGGDIAASTGSRLVSGVLDIPGIPGDIGGLVKGAARWTADQIHGVFGETPEEQAARHQLTDQNGSNPLLNLPTSEGIKSAVGFKPYQPQTAAGKIYDKYVGAGIEMVPGVVATGATGLLRTAVQQGTRAAIRRGAADVARYAVAPAAAGEFCIGGRSGRNGPPVAGRARGKVRPLVHSGRSRLSGHAQARARLHGKSMVIRVAVHHLAFPDGRRDLCRRSPRCAGRFSRPGLVDPRRSASCGAGERVSLRDRQSVYPGCSGPGIAVRTSSLPVGNAPQRAFQLLFEPA